MRPLLNTVVFLLVVSPLARAADPAPTLAELKDIKQLSEDIFGLPKRGLACVKLGDYGPKAWSAVPNLTESLTAGKEKDTNVLAAAAIALGRIGGPNAVKVLKAFDEKNKEPLADWGVTVGLSLAGNDLPARKKALAGFATLSRESAKQWVRHGGWTVLLSDTFDPPATKRDAILRQFVLRLHEWPLFDKEMFDTEEFDAFLAECDKCVERLDPKRKAVFIEKVVCVALHRKNWWAMTHMIDEVVASCAVVWLTAEEASIRAMAAVCLGALDQGGSIASVRDAAKEDSSLRTSLKVFPALKMTVRVEALPKLKELLKDPSPTVAALAAEAIKNIEKK